MDISFYFDPICPWSWIAARWIDEVSLHRDLTVNWRSFSIDMKNDDLDRSERSRARQFEGRQALRLIEAARSHGTEGVVQDLYWEMGRRFHHDRARTFDFESIVETVGLQASLAASADDDRWDPIIWDSMERALVVVGQDVGVPTIVLDVAEPVGFHGPILSPQPTGPEALDLYDHLIGLASAPGFFELKRDHDKANVGKRP